MKIFNERSCPHCHKTIKLQNLIKIPITGSLKWYQFTPTAKLVCPECQRVVNNTISNSKWLFLPFFSLSVIVVSLLVDFKLPLIVQAMLMLLAIVGVGMAAKNGMLVSGEDN